MYYNFDQRPFVVLNGRSSKSIQGLIISKLPQITKPRVRTKVETVDGRDGDLVTVLGYAAYNKEIEIGLSYEYNIDDVTTFFNSSGKVVFSNEPDKYYLYSIYDQIDFEKLVRFKTASVTFHVQPFKYSELETERVFNEILRGGKEISIRNNGNVISRPTISILGAGDISLFINGEKILDLDLPSTGEKIIIDSEAMNAYNEDRSRLLNRQVIGNYDKIKLDTGANKISYTGTVSKLWIDKYTRWV